MTSSSVVLLISMPTLGQISTPTTKCLIGLTQYLSRKDIPFAFETYEFSDIVFSRNQLMCSFYTRKQFTHMLCIDSDMAIEPAGIQRLLDRGVDFAATAYPQKHPRWNRLRKLIEAEADCQRTGSRPWISCSAGPGSTIIRRQASAGPSGIPSGSTGSSPYRRPEPG